MGNGADAFIFRLSPIPKPPRGLCSNSSDFKSSWSVCDLSQNDGLRVFNLLLRKKRVALAFMTAIGAVTRSRPLDACTGGNFEISQAVLYGTLSPQITIIIRSDWNTELAAEIIEITRAKTPHG